MWIVAGVIAVITFVLSFMMKDYRPVDSDFSFDKVKVVIKHKEFLSIFV